MPFTSSTLLSGIPARQAWPFAPDVIPLNHGSFGAVPRDVITRRAELLQRADESPVGWFPHVPEYVQDARRRVAGFVGAAASDTAFVPNASAGATVVFNSLHLTPGAEILVTNHGYGAVTLGARRLAQRTGAVLRTVEIALDATDDEVVAAFETALTDRVQLVVVDQITSSTAKLLPTARITDAAHRFGARVLVDGAHAPGLVPNASTAAGGDWWFGNLHKWPCAPRGAALLVTQDPDRDTLWPLIDSWGANEPFPRRFDFQATHDATPHLTAGDAIEWIEAEYGWDRTRERMHEVADAMQRTIAAALTPEAPLVSASTPSMRLVQLPGTLGSTREVADALRSRLYDATRIECAFTSFDGVGFLRTSAHLYSEPEDISAFLARAVPLLHEWARDER